jgi:hypothetical protein
MSAAFYKTTDGAALAAWVNYEVDAAKVGAAGQAFAAHFGGMLLIRADSHGRSIAGLRFSPAKDDPLWTKPDQQANGRQHPRASLKKATKEQRQALVALQADWEARFPREKADLAPVLAAMGTDWGNLFFTGIKFFVHDGAIYVSTSAKLAPCMVEILASEYNAARAAYESIKGAA